MNTAQIQAIAGVMRFLTTNEFKWPNSARELINSCTTQLKKLEEAGVEAKMREEVYKIFEEHINCYL